MYDLAFAGTQRQTKTRDINVAPKYVAPTPPRRHVRGRARSQRGSIGHVRCRRSTLARPGMGCNRDLLADVEHDRTEVR